MNQSAEIVKVSTPGSIMIIGEHAVVYGYRAIVAAIDQRIEVSLQRRSDGMVGIHSDIAPPFECSIDDLPDRGVYRFVLAALALYRSNVTKGCDLRIRSQINTKLGLGSSAAVAIAALGALAQFSKKVSREQLHSDAFKIVNTLQGRGSGADLAASLYGGFVAYRAPGSKNARAEISALSIPDPSLSLRYSGYKTPTAEVLGLIADRRVGREAEFDAIYARMGRVAETAIENAESNLSAFYGAVSEYQDLMAELGVSDETLDRIVAEAVASPQTLAAKISGSGLGDCVLAFGETPMDFEPVTVAKDGMIVHV